MVSSWIGEQDIVFLCETMTSNPIYIPGYTVFYGNDSLTTTNRGGTALLVRNNIAEYIYDVDITCCDQIWFRVSFMPNVIFGGCYIPPSDSPYYDEQCLANLERKCVDSCNEFILFGDLNSRLGRATQTLVDRDPAMEYTVTDPVNNPNYNGSKLIGILRDCDLFVVNNMTYRNKCFGGHLTYRMRTRWVSELDLFIVSHRVLNVISELCINTCLNIPSDHSPISLAVNCGDLKSASTGQLLRRANQLGDHSVLHSTAPVPPGDDRPRRRRALPHDHIDLENFNRKLELTDPFDILDNDLGSSIESFCDIMYDIAKESKVDSVDNDNQYDNRWKNILMSNDDKLLWKAIDWNGAMNTNCTQRPSDDEFKVHLESLFNPDGISELDPEDYVSDIYVPVLDDPIDPIEVSDVLQKQLNANKSAGADGLSPSLFKQFPVQWILALSVILNNVFVQGYPAKWAYSRLSMLFKKGDFMNCNNYRGISVINCISKIYDYVLYNRLSKWFTPHREQAGAQPKRGCIEHIVTLRLIIDMCFRKKWKLFIAYIDFSKAYDRVPRNKLMFSLKRLGCGFMMLFAIAAMYKVTKSILGIAVITAVIGVRQGSPTSCFLFNLFVNTLITTIKERCGNDGFLSWLHVLMLMDDTVILATSRRRLVEKLNILYDYCEDSGMVINTDKTKFMVINAHGDDTLPINIRGNILGCCDEYVYLGAVFTSDGSLKSSIAKHADDKAKHLHKLIMFLNTNRDFPFCVKRKVVEAAFNSAILYGCESWIGGNCHEVEKLYICAIKYLLGVHKSTANDLCLIELGMLPLPAVVKQRQYNFLYKAMNTGHLELEDPLMFAISLTRLHNPTLARCIDNILATPDHMETTKRVMYQRLNVSNRSKFIVYRNINPSYSVHSVYSSRSSLLIPEVYRMSFSRLRLSSHRLRIETGRWSRIPRDRRLCPCGQIQDEEHVLAHCRITQHLRDAHGDPVNFPEILHAIGVKDFRLIHGILQSY